MLMTPITPKVMASPMPASTSTEPSDRPKNSVSTSVEYTPALMLDRALHVRPRRARARSGSAIRAVLARRSTIVVRRLKTSGFRLPLSALTAARRASRPPALSDPHGERLRASPRARRRPFPSAGCSRSSATRVLIDGAHQSRCTAASAPPRPGRTRSKLAMAPRSALRSWLFVPMREKSSARRAGCLRGVSARIGQRDRGLASAAR